MHHFVLILTLYLSALAAAGGAQSKTNSAAEGHDISMTTLEPISKRPVHDDCRHFKVRITSPKAKAKTQTPAGTKGPSLVATPYRQVLMIASCRRPMADGVLPQRYGLWDDNHLRETVLDLDKCAGWNAKTNSLTPESDGKGFMKGDCWSCRYTESKKVSRKGDFQCYCDNVDKKLKHTIPQSKVKSYALKFDIDSVLWSKDGHLNCHNHIGS
ncbi:hypothetical protein BDV26DRAFT_295173 [Aspergillus bertholletiae]|uniref:Cyanovirin-N domain-containing protein n=1 Tax=Aspergillus bertholletiae TaxID=1226010 RepID=A0A5N7B281_9EURO|nr:hypothetical protein BDV26DRAFT_295173 [Aspergillus bertholletiae]